MNERDILRKKAKKLYKEQAKGVPKNRRISFKEFFAKFKDIHGQQSEVSLDGEDFDFEDLINTTDIEDTVKEEQ